MHGRLYGIGEDELKRRIPAMLAAVGLTPHGNKQLRHFSKGMLQRIGLAQALLNEPDLLFLDEPTSGLDPVGRRLVRDIIKTQRDRGATVFLNSHLLSEVEITCDRVAFIKAGEVLELRDVGSFSDERRTVLLRATGLSPEAIERVSDCAQVLTHEGDRWVLSLKPADAAPGVLKYLIDSGAQVFEFTPTKVSLEERFLEILGRDEGL